MCGVRRHVSNVPCVDGSWLARTFFTSQAWSVLPCVRPLAAVHMTAGHNALRGSGPGQQHAFDDAMARVGCPDRRIDRLCITCCSPSQPSHHAWILGAISSDLQRSRIVVPRARSHHCPSYWSELFGECEGRDFGRAPGQQRREPGPMLRAMQLGIADHSKRASHKKATQIAITLFADTAELLPASARVLLGHKTNPSREVAA